jgi:hypothetical protein
MANQIKEDTRAFGGRSKERRESEMRAIMDMEYEDMTYIPPEIIPKGMVYGWGRYSVRNEPTPERIIQLRKKGWDFVPADRHPEMSFSNIGADDPRTSGYIWRGGLVLMERPVEYQEMEIKKMVDRNYKILLTTPGAENFIMPVDVKTQYYTGPLEEHRNASFG